MNYKSKGKHQGNYIKYNQRISKLEDIPFEIIKLEKKKEKKQWTEYIAHMGYHKQYIFENPSRIKEIKEQKAYSKK